MQRYSTAPSQDDLEERIRSNTREMYKWDSLEGKEFCFLEGPRNRYGYDSLIRIILRHKGVHAVL